MEHTYRNGPLGAMMDEYERAAVELLLILEDVSDAEYEKIYDAKTKDEDCRSIQTVMRHMIGSGYSYADSIRKVFGVPSTRPKIELVPRLEAIEGVEKMLAYTAHTLEGKWDTAEEDVHKINVASSWGQPYTLEQILEHAIVHILRHRRQIERFLVFAP